MKQLKTPPPQAATLDAAEHSLAELRKRLPATHWESLKDERFSSANGVVLTAILQFCFLKDLFVVCIPWQMKSIFFSTEVWLSNPLFFGRHRTSCNSWNLEDPFQAYLGEKATPFEFSKHTC